MRQAIVLFAHGSRDAAWSRPFEQIAASLSKKLPGTVVELAYLELMRPTLDEVFRKLSHKVGAIRVVPVFLGHGGHLREDLPKIVAAARAAHPRLDISLDKPIGEQPAVIEAIAEAIAAPPRAAPPSP